MSSIAYATSRDGTQIGFDRTGDGPPLVLIHGTSADRTRWAPVRPMLEEHYTVYAVDRRGRGLSGDAPKYALEREYEDAAAVIEAVAGAAGSSVDVFGHSYGALVAMEAALQTTHVRRLALYEPPVPTGVPLYEEGLQGRLETLLERGDREGALVAFFREVVGLSDADMAAMKAAPSWPARIAAAHTIPREFADGDYVLDPARLARITQPVLLLAGTESEPFLKRATEAVAEALPNSRVELMEGQGHVATTTAPDLVARLVVDFLNSAG